MVSPEMLRRFNCFSPVREESLKALATIAREESPEKLAVVQTLATERGAKTMIVDPASHKIYLGAAKYVTSTTGGKQKSAMLPGSFRVLVYGMSK